MQVLFSTRLVQAEHVHAEDVLMQRLALFGGARRSESLSGSNSMVQTWTQKEAFDPWTGLLMSVIGFRMCLDPD